MTQKIIIVMALIGIFATFGFLNFYYLEAIKSSHDSGVQNGKEEGFQLGYNDGNYSGYTFGYGTGLETGYESGFYYGNITGYQLGFSNGNETGFADGYTQGFEARGYNIRDLTYEKAIDFIFLDKTDKNECTENYTCLNFAADFKNNAFESGYRCGFVRIVFPVYAHAIVCFNTTDRGLIFIEPQADEIVTLTIGQPYWDRSIYESPDYDDTIVSFVIIW